MVATLRKRIVVKSSGNLSADNGAVAVVVKGSVKMKLNRLEHSKTDEDVLAHRSLQFD
jgi:hypothetical protein